MRISRIVDIRVFFLDISDAFVVGPPVRYRPGQVKFVLKAYN
jgi:hypothetical protein